MYIDYIVKHYEIFYFHIIITDSFIGKFIIRIVYSSSHKHTCGRDNLKLKLTLIFILSLLIFMPISLASPSIIISDYELSPPVLMPGEDAILKLTIKNSDTSSSKTTVSGSTTSTYSIGATIESIRIDAAEYVNWSIAGTEVYYDVGYLAPSASFDISFKLEISEGIPEGLYFPKVLIDVSSFEDASFPIPVNISNSTVNIIPNQVSKKISMSGSTDIVLTVVNNRDSNVDGVTITPNEVEGIDFLPNSYYIGNMDAYSSENITFSIKPTDIGNKNITFRASFKNGDNTHTSALNLNIEIIKTLDVSPIFYDFPSVVEKDGTKRIRLEVFNAKNSEITGVIVTPITEAKLSPSQYFIGSMDPDDVFAASFDILTNEMDLGEYEIDFKVTFKQDNEYFETPIVTNSFNLVASEQTTGDSNIVIFIFIILVIAALILFYLYKKGRILK